jgi:hypothetical protein
MKILSTVILLAFCLNSKAQTWIVTPKAPMPMASANCAFEIDSSEQFIYTFGGIDTSLKYSGIHQKCFKYTIQNNTWSTVQDMPDTLGKIAAGASLVRGNFFTIGGYHVYSNGSEKSSSRVHRFPFGAQQFFPDGSAIPIAIDDQAQAVWRDSLIYVVSGWSNTTNVNNVQIYNPYIDTWYPNSSFTPNNNLYKAFGASGTIVGDTIYYFGGATIGANFPVSSQLRKGVIDVSSPLNVTWSNTDLAPQVGYRMACAGTKDFVYWFGGSTQTYNYDGKAYANGAQVKPSGKIIRYHLASKTWQVFNDIAINMDYRGCAKVNDSTFYLVGGIDSLGQASDACLELKLKNYPTSLGNAQMHAFTISPNPNHGVLQINGIANYKGLLIYNAQGAIVYQSDKQAKYDITKLATGQYFAELLLDNNEVIGKQFIKE